MTEFDSLHSGANQPRAVQLTLYFREGCHLCEDMEQLLHELLDPQSFQLHKVDIDDDEILRASYNARVPVLSCEDIEVCEHFLDLDALRNALKQAHASYNNAGSVLRD